MSCTRYKKLMTATMASLWVLVSTSVALAADGAPERYSSLDTIWVLMGAFLVFFMQPGFAMVEAGLTRAKNAGNIVMKNLMDFALGTIVFWVIGFGLMFGTDISGIIGAPDFFVQHFTVGEDAGYPPMAYLIFQTVFCATAATIVSGAMAERTKFSAYCIYSILISAIIYPISGHWAWGGGWLSELGFHDFAGSTVVHMVGGVSALVGAKILGPRIGKYNKDGSMNAIPGHSLTLAALGAFILWFGWFGFNGGSTVSATGDETLLAISNIYVTTNMAAAVAATTVMLLTWLRYGKPDVSMTLNGALAGLVAITAGTDAVDPFGSVAIGFLAGIAVVFAVEFFDKVAKIDDPVGAISVHGVCGALGTILTGLFAVDGGLLYGGGTSLLLTQIIGVVAVAIYVAVIMTVVFYIIKATIGLRVSSEEELAGLDLEEHGLASAYADFMPRSRAASTPVIPITVVPAAGTARTSADAASASASASPASVNPTGSTPVSSTAPAAPAPVVSIDQAIPVETRQTVSADGHTFTLISIITADSRFEMLKDALEQAGITGMTVTKVLGHGLQKGHTELYRGSEVKAHLLPKVKVDLVVSAVPVKTITDIAKQVLYTGHYGDGKIFIYRVENVIKIRTGEEGYDALQDMPTDNGQS